MTDILTIIWKESREFLHQRGTMRGTIAMMAIPTLILGVLFPLQTGLIWVESPFSLTAWTFVPVIMIVALIADSFAGERERHTLETLLASRLSDTTILFGKICAAMCYAIILTVIIVMLGLITVNIAHGEGRLLLYPADICAAGAVLSIMTACFAASLGVLISLRASTVRQAQQTLTIGIIIIAFTPGILAEVLPDAAKHSISSVLDSVGMGRLFLVTVAVLLISDSILILAAKARFKRTKLILD